MSLILKYDLGNPHRLPVGYTPLAYIESTGTQYIDTTCLGNSNTSIILDYIYTELVSSAGIIGTGRGGTTEPMNGFRFYYNGANKYYVSCNSKLNASTLPSSPLYYAGERYHTLMNGSSGVITTNGSSVTVSSYGAGSDNTYSLMLFKAYSACCKAKLYKCIIIQNGISVRDFIPAKNSSGIIGLFDCISQTFFTNQGTGEFIAGPEVVVLPYEYQQVEYLESDGTSTSPYIKFTDRGLQADDILQINASILRVNNNAQPSIFGYSGVAQIYFPNRVLSYWRSEYIQGNTPSSGTTITLGTRYQFKSTIKNTLASWNLFTYTSSYYPANARIEQVIITRNSNVIMCLIPCYRRSDLKPGMYDTVNNVFYTNSGTGEFVLGPTVEESSRQLEYNNASSDYIGLPTNVHYSNDNPFGVNLPGEYSRVQYLESNGTQYIDTNLTVKSDTLPEFEYQFTNTSTNYVFGQVAGSGASILGYRSNRIWWYTANDISVANTQKHYVKFEGSKVYLDNNPIANKGTFGNQQNLNILLFAESNDNNAINKGSVRIFKFKVKEGSTLVRNFVPCYRKSDNKPGMFDTVNRVFYINQGTGEFTCGPEYNAYYGGSSSFNGTSSYVKSVNNIGFSGDPNISISAWVKCIDSTWNTDYVGICGGTTYSTGKNWFLMLKQGKPDFDFWSCRVIANNAISLGQWHHLVVTKSPGTLSTSTVKIYVDGQAVATTAQSAQTPAITNSPVQIGRADSAGRFFHGYISDLRIYDNVLTADEVLKIYKGGL